MGVSGAVQSSMGVMAPTLAGILYQVRGVQAAFFSMGYNKKCRLVQLLHQWCQEQLLYLY